MPAESLKNFRSENERLRSENEELRLRLDEAEQTIEAIRTGQVESLIVEGPDGPRIFSFEGSDYAYRVLIEAMSEGAATLSEHGTILFCNHRFAELLGAPLERLMGKPIRQFLPDHAQDGFDAMVRQASEGDSRGELELLGAGGHALPVFLSMSVIRDADSRRLCLVATDLRAQKRSEEIVVAERLARAVLEQAAESIVVCDAQGLVIRANRAARELCGRNPLLAPIEVGFALVLDSSQALAAETRVASRALRGEVLASVPAWLLRSDGSKAHLLVSAAPLIADRDRIIGCVVTMTDITERNQREALLADERRLHKTVTDNATLALFIMDSHQRCVFLNPAAEHLTGFTFAELQGRPLHDAIHHTRPDGRPYAVEECPIDRALPTRNQEQGEDVFVHKDGHFYPVAFTASPIVENGILVGTVIEVRDTTLDKETERKLRHAVAVREEFLTIASHELRTPLTALNLQLERIKKLLADGDKPKVLKNVDTAIRQAERLESLIEALLNVSRIAVGRLQLQLSQFDLRSLVEETVDRLSVLSERAACKVEMNLCDEAMGTWDRHGIDEVLMNLLSNAIKYGPGKPIDVAVVADSDWVSLSVKDNGIGIDPDAQARIFGRFERAVSINYAGLGLGLFISRHIVEAHGGSLTVQSLPSEGATFTVRLPRHAQATQVPSVFAHRDEVRL